MIELPTSERSLNTKTKPLPTCMLCRHAASSEQTLDEMGETLHWTQMTDVSDGRRPFESGSDGLPLVI